MKHQSLYNINNLCQAVKFHTFHKLPTSCEKRRTLQEPCARACIWSAREFPGVLVLLPGLTESARRISGSKAGEYIRILYIHSRKLTWTLRMGPWKTLKDCFPLHNTHGRRSVYTHPLCQTGYGCKSDYMTKWKEEELNKNTRSNCLRWIHGWGHSHCGKSKSGGRLRDKCKRTMFWKRRLFGKSHSRIERCVPSG